MAFPGPSPCSWPIVVMGASGAGKSTVGTAIAQRLHVPYADGDEFHSRAAIAKMADGQPLHDEDRQPWLVHIGLWLKAHSNGSVVSCSALKRRYRDTLRSYAPTLYVLHLEIDPDLARERIRARKGHFMPATLIASQFEDLEPLGPDERGMTIRVTRAASIEEVVTQFLARCAAPE